MVGHRDVDDSPTVVRQENKYEQQPERDRRHDEEVGGHDLAHVIGQERSPGLGRWTRMPSHVFSDGRLTDRDAQLLELPMDPRRTPQRIRGGQLADQIANVWWDTGASRALAALPGPEQPKAAAVPRDDRLRRDDVDGVSSSRRVRSMLSACATNSAAIVR